MAAILGAQTAAALQLIVNGAPIEGVDVSNITANSGTVQLTTTGAVLTTGGDGTTPTPTPIPTPTPNPNPTPTPTPGPTNGCVSNAEIECAFDIPVDRWTGSVLKETLTIPKGKTLASAITTNGDNKNAGNFAYETPTGGVSAKVSVWISATPNGDPLWPTKCFQTNVSFLYSLSYTQDPAYAKYRCLLALNTTYFLNMRHVSPDTPASKIWRQRK